MSDRRKMRVLVIYYKGSFVERLTVDEHLYSFRRYADPDCSIYYLNTLFGVPSWITRLHFDLVIYHYTFVGMKWDKASWPRFMTECEPLKRLSAGHTMAIQQDEYVNSDLVNPFLRDFGVKTMVTCLVESEWEKIYPRARSGLEHLITVAPGYVDEKALAWLQSIPPAPRTIDIGYRARNVPFWLGRHGTLKGTIAVEFKKASGTRDLTLDISTEYKDVFYGDEWYRFLLRCRTVLGCEGGASLHDPDGQIRERVEAYVAAHPDASFDEVERACFPGLDGNLDLFAISPRHFECAMTRTTQVLVEGQYHGIMRPGVHYIEVKKDWSNIPEVLAQVRDVALCERLAETCYQDLVASGLHTYRVFVKRLLDHGRRFAPPRRTPPVSVSEAALLRVLELREAENSRIRVSHEAFLRWRGIARAYRDDLTHPDGRPNWYRIAAFVQPRVLRVLGLTRAAAFVQPRVLRALGLRRAPWSEEREGDAPPR